MKRYLKWWEKILLILTLWLCLMLAVGVITAVFHFINSGADGGRLLLMVIIALFILFVFKGGKR